MQNDYQAKEKNNKKAMDPRTIKVKTERKKKNIYNKTIFHKP